MRLSCSFLFLVTSSAAGTVLVHANVATTLITQTRRLLNLGGLFGSATQTATPYERVAGHPVFQVSTAWGSAYMNMEKMSDMDRQEADLKKEFSSTSIAEQANEYRTVCLFYMDPDDAISVHAELKQMQQMEKSDIRITAGSLAKALRQAGNLGNGLVTGAPVDPSTGNVRPVDEGGSLRYKIMPPKRQLYYAARCVGKERVGLFGDNRGSDDAMMAILGNSALEGMNLERRREKRERKGPRKTQTLMEAQNAHMEGYIGIPVFYCPSIRKQQPKLKQLISGSSQENPMFFNYEDMVEAWGNMKQRNPNQKLPDKPPSVEVFNLWDVLTSMEKEAWKQKKAAAAKRADWVLKPIRKRLASSKDQQPGLESVVFIPSSHCIDYKEAISKRGNGKARLRPMRG